MSDIQDEPTDPMNGYEGIVQLNKTGSEGLVVSWSLSNGIRLLIEDDEVDGIAHFHFASDEQIEKVAQTLLSYMRRKKAGGWHD